MTYFSAGTITSFTVTTSGTYNVVAAGAQGGIDPRDLYLAAAGATVEATVHLIAGTMLNVVVGSSGVGGYVSGGGGGGTFIYDLSNTLIIAAGGGGGGGTGGYNPILELGKVGVGISGVGVANASSGSSGNTGATAGGSGGSSGSGGGASGTQSIPPDQAYSSGGGAGWLGAGGTTVSLYNGIGGSSYPSFLGGAGFGTSPDTGYGGFGGGGGSAGYSGGGGGGYSGGGGGGVYAGGGGGGSYLIDTATLISSYSGNNSADGYATLTLVSADPSGFFPYVYINGYSTTSHDVNGSMNYGQSSFLSSRDSSAKVILGSGLTGTLGSINTLMTVASLVALSFPSASANTSSPNALPSAPLDGGIIADLMVNQGVHSSMVNYLFASDFTGQGTIAVSNDFHSNFVDVLISNGDKSSSNTPLALSQFKGIALTGLGVNVTGITVANSVIGEGSASYQMSAGNETMVLNGINAQVDGGAGIDTVVIQGGRRSAAIISDLGNDRVRLWSGTSTVTGLNTLNNIERIVFTDGAIALDTAAHEHAGQAYLLYGVFNRAPDQIGLGYWIDALDSAHSTNSIAQAFINSNEFGSTNGNNLSSAAFISTLYQNILHRTADAGGHAYWTQELQGSDTVMHRASVLEGFAFSSERVGLVGTLLAKGIDYQVYNA